MLSSPEEQSNDTCHLLDIHVCKDWSSEIVMAASEKIKLMHRAYSEQFFLLLQNHADTSSKKSLVHGGHKNVALTKKLHIIY